MVKSYLIRDIPRSFNDLFDSFFLNWPDSPKPPMDSIPILNPDAPENEQLKGWEIQMALAGFTEKDLRVWHEGQVLHIAGDNRSNDHVTDKFLCSFHHAIPISKDLDLTGTKVSLKDGILSVQMPIDTSTRHQNHLFGLAK